MGSLAIGRMTIVTAVPNGGTVTMPNPAGINAASGSTPGGSATVGPNGRFKVGTGAGTISIAYGATTSVITNNTGETWPVGAELTVGFGDTTIGGSYNLTNPAKVQNLVDKHLPPAP